jgi:BASS family bile acid:Na+ symporter
MAGWLQITGKASMVVFLVAGMLAVGLTLTPRSLATPLRRPGFVLVALALNFVLAPALAWLLTIIIPLQRGHAIGLLLLGGAAGAPFLPKLIEVSRGNMESGVALMILLTTLTILFMPLALPFLIPGLNAPPWTIARPLVLLIALPLAAGMLIRLRAGVLAARAAPVLGGLANVALLVFIGLLLVVNFPALISVIGSGAVAAAILHVSGLFAAGWMCGGAQADRRGVLGLATAARNFGAALVPAAQSFDDPGVTVMLIVCAVVGLVLCFLAAFWARPRMHQPKPSLPAS